MITQLGETSEDIDNSGDYLALHICKDVEPGKKITGHGSYHTRSHYHSEQTHMVRVMNLEPSEYVNTGKMLNLVLDQTERKKNLYYKIDVFSSVNFNCQRLGQKFKYRQTFDIAANTFNGGRRSSPFFY